MSAKQYFCIIILAFVMILYAGCTQPAAQQPVPPSPAPMAVRAEPAVTMTNPVAPIPFNSTNGVNTPYNSSLPDAGHDKRGDNG